MKINPRRFSILLVLHIFVCTHLFAQRENDNWFFPDKSAITFPSGASPAEVTGASQITGDVSISVSDKTTGQLLFYSNGLTVWNNNHQVMDNGGAIFSPGVCSQVMYAPNPANTLQYYIFSFTGTIISYALVDVSVNGGLGSVVSKNNVVAPFATRKFTLAKHGSYDAYWLITLRGSNGNDTFECYPITTAGVQLPIRSIMGFNNGDFAYLSEMITNRAGDKIVVTNYSAIKPEISVYTFSKNCGTVSTPKQLPIANGWTFPRGLAFSSNDNYLYASINITGIGGSIVRYSGIDYQNMEIVPAIGAVAFSDICLGPDDNLYILKNSGGQSFKSLDVIANAGTASPVYINNGFTFTNSQPSFYFPNFITDISVPGTTQKTPIITVTRTCYQDTTLFTPSDMPLIDSLDWDFGNPASSSNTSKLDVPTHIFTHAGTYTVTLSWYNCGIKSSAFKTVQIISPSSLYLGPDSTLCHGDTLILYSPVKNLDLTWNDGSKDTSLTVTKPGLYSLTASAGPRCTSSDSIIISYYPKLAVDFFNESYFVCEDANETMVLSADTGYASYLWTPGSSAASNITVQTPGWYYVDVKNTKGCNARDSVFVGSQCDNTFFIPNAFTPNDDGRNDKFAPAYSDIYNYRLEIYTRWGEKVFETTNPATGWDGTHKGYACEAGPYIWRLTYQGNKYKIVRTYTQKGVVNLVR